MLQSFKLDTEALTKELRLILALLSIESQDGLPAGIRQAMNDIDWPLFMQLARHHRVHPFLYLKMKNVNEHESGIPPFILQSLQRDYRKNTFHMLQLSGEMASLSKILADHDIRSIYLKGPVIAKDLYGDVSLRTSSDLDLLIPMKDLMKAEALLCGLGYEKDEYITTVLSDWKWRHHHFTFHHPVKGIKVEIHWRLHPSPSSEPRFEELWARRRQSELFKYPIYFLGSEDLFLFLITHGARHGWSRLRWLLDIRQYMKQNPDISRLIALMQKHRYTPIAGQALLLAEQLLQTPRLAALEPLLLKRKSKRLAQDAMFYIKQMVNLHTDPVPEEVERYHKRHLFRLLTVRQKMIVIMSFFFPFPEDAETLPLPKRLHVLYFPLRPILWAVRKAIGGQK